MSSTSEVVKELKPASNLDRLRSVEIALAVLDALGGRAPMNLSEIASRVGIAKSTAHRTCTVLMRAGLLARNEEKKYSLGLKVVEYGRNALGGSAISQQGLTALSELYGTTGLTVQMGVAEGGDVVYVHRIQSPDYPRISPVRRPIHCTSAGKVLAAWDEGVLAAGVRKGLRPVTRHTIVVPAVLTSELADVRSQGYARCVDELHMGWTSLAVPVRAAGPGNKVVAAFAATGPTLKMTGSRERSLVSQLGAAARRFEQRLRGQP